MHSEFNPESRPEVPFDHPFETYETAELDSGVYDITDETAPLAEEQAQEPEPTRLVRPKNYIILGLDVPDTARCARVIDEIQLKRATTRFPEAMPTHEEAELVSDLNDAYVTLGREVGLDIHHRTLDIKDIYIFADKNAFCAADREVKGEEPRQARLGFQRNDSGVLWTRAADPIANSSGIAHEMGHHYSACSMVFSDTKMYRITTGSGERNGKGLREMAADLMAKNTLHMLGYPSMKYYYASTDRLGDILIRGAAALYGVTPHHIEKEIIRGELDTAYDGMKPIHDFLGSEGRITALKRLLPNTIDNTVAIARWELEFNEDVLEKIGAEHYIPFEWDRPWSAKSRDMPATDLGVPKGDIYTGLEKTRSAARHQELLPQPAIAKGQFLFSGYLAFSPNTAARHIRQVNIIREITAFGNEVPPSDAEADMVHSLNDAYVALGDSLGVDLRERVIPLGHCHFFDTVKALQEAMYGSKDRGTGATGRYRLGEGILLLKQPDEESKARVLANAMARNFAIKRASGAAAWFDHQIGNWQVSKPLAVAARDMLLGKALERAGLANEPTYFCYRADVITDWIIEGMANQYDLRPAEIGTGLMRDELIGGLKAIKGIRGYLGERFDTFNAIKPTADLSEASEVATRLGFSKDELGRLNPRNGYRPYSWLYDF